MSNFWMQVLWNETSFSFKLSFRNLRWCLCVFQLIIVNWFSNGSIFMVRGCKNPTQIMLTTTPSPVFSLSVSTFYRIWYMHLYGWSICYCSKIIILFSVLNESVVTEKNDICTRKFWICYSFLYILKSWS